MKTCLTLCAAALAVAICRGATVDLAQTGDLSLTALDNANEYVNGGAELRTLTVTSAATRARRLSSAASTRTTPPARTRGSTR